MLWYFSSDFQFPWLWHAKKKFLIIHPREYPLKQYYVVHKRIFWCSLLLQLLKVETFKLSAYRVKNPLGCNIKCISSSIDPVNDPLPMCILIMIHFTICITKGIPVLSYRKVRFTCFQVVLYIATPKSPDKVKPPPIIPNFFPEK